MLDPKVIPSRRVVRPGLARRHYGGGDVFTDGRKAFAADQSMGTHKITNLGAPAAGTSDAARISDVEAAAAAAVATLGVKKATKVSLSAQQVNGGSPAIVSWDTEEFDYGGQWAIGDPTKIYAAQTGLYDIKAQGHIDDGGAAGVMAILVNGVVKAYFQGVKGASTFGDTYPYFNLCITVALTAGDYVQLQTAGMTGAGAHTLKVTNMVPTLSVELSASNASGGGDFLADGTIPMTGDFDANSHKVKNLPAPAADNDAARKKYVDDAIAAVVASIAFVPYAKAFMNRTAGDVTCPGSLTQIGTTVNFTMSAPGMAEFRGNISFDMTSGIASTAIGLDVDGTQYYWDVWNAGIGAVTQSKGSFSIALALAAGAHTAKLLHAGSNAASQANANSPASLVVDYQP